MTITKQIIKSILKHLLSGEDYRIEIVNLIDTEFLQFAIEFFKKIAEAKLKSKDITVDWYKKTFLKSSLSSKEIAIHSGLNKKTIHNMFNSSTKQIVIDASNEHYDFLYKAIDSLVSSEHELELMLTIKFKGVSVDLNISESLIVINVLAVKRAELRGGFWSTAGKKVEKPLMQTLCRLYKVPKENYSSRMADQKGKDSDFERETDFYLKKGDKLYKCEVKLMGKGNPESADGAIARGSNIFIADKLSETNKKQLDRLNIEWLELRAKNGFMRFSTILKKLKIPHTPIKQYTRSHLNKIFKDIL